MRGEKIPMAQFFFPKLTADACMYVTHVLAFSQELLFGQTDKIDPVSKDLSSITVPVNIQSRRGSIALKNIHCAYNTLKNFFQVISTNGRKELLEFQ